jgi:hypothetical protein
MVSIKTYTITYILIISILYVLSSLYIDTEMLNTPQIHYDKLQDIANTGDLIIFRWNIIDLGFRLFSKFTHVGMIVKHKHKLYLLENHPNENLESEINNAGVHLYSLKKRLKNYGGTYYFTKLENNTSTKNTNANILKNHISQNLKIYKKTIQFDSNFRTSFVLYYICNLLNVNISKRTEMFCSEFIATILENCNVYKYHHSLTSINPGTFLEFTKNKKKLYGPLYHIHF